MASVRRVSQRPDAILVSGDLAEHGCDDEYALVAAELGVFGVPVLVVPGNHDDRAALRRCFSLPGNDDAPVYYTADVGPLPLVMLDTTIPGRGRR